MKKNFPIGTVVLFGSLVLLAGIVIAVLSKTTAQIPQELAAVLRPVPRAIQAFEFIDQTGKPYTQEDLSGKWTFVFFGYTYCPDICPTTLSVLTSLTKHLQGQIKSTNDPQTLLISVDPQRDKPELLKKYLAFFHKDFVGITAADDKTLALARQFGAMYFKEEKGDPKNYLVAHASSIYLVNPRGEMVASFSPPHDYKTIASQFRAILKLKL
ncbi:SCO family protein [Pseudomonadota bacterium]